ncbi:5'-3' exonuclease family protein, partial [Chlamydia psittaci 08-2626_L3]
KIPGAFESR